MGQPRLDSTATRSKNVGMVQLLRFLGDCVLKSRELANTKRVPRSVIISQAQYRPGVADIRPAMGLSVPQAMLIIVVSRILVALFSTMIAWIGLKWHIGFTVQVDLLKYQT